jgi:heptosyltransferase-1
MKICIVKLSAMGDIIHAMVALQFIKKALPHATIDWVVESAFSGVLEGNPHINNILKVNLKSIKKKKMEIFSQIKLLKSYAKNDYDIVIDAQGLLKSAIVSKIIGGTIIAGFDKESIREGIASYFYTKKIHMPYDANTIDRNVAVLTKPLNIDVSSEDIINKEPFLFYDNEQKTPQTPYNLFVIGSTWESRNYPKEKFVAIAEALRVKTYIIWGSEEEKSKALWMQEQSQFLEILPRDSLHALKAVVAKASLLIGNDTGPTHMAWGLNTPSITIFGPTPTNRVYTTPQHKVIKSDSVVNHFKLNKNDFSIYDIDPQNIIQLAEELMACTKK